MPLTIGELAKRTGVNRETVRYYERRRRCRGSRHLLPLQRYDQAPAILFHENIDDVLTSSQPFAHANALLNRIASPLQRQNHHAFKDGAFPVSRLIIAAVSHCQDLVDRGAITRTADEPRAFQPDQFEAEIAVQMLDLIRNHRRAGMPCEPSCQSYLILPREVLLGVLRELDVVGRVGIDEIVRFQLDLFEVTTAKIPVRENRSILGEILFVRDVFVASEGNVELALSVEAAQPVVASAI